MNLDDFSYEENGRRYIDPNVSLNEQNDFIQKLRDTQGQRNAQIAQQTHNLGTDVPSNLGGLNGSEAYFNARYQTPQTNNLVGELKSAAQAQALQTALNNELSKAQKRYNDAYRAAAARTNGTSGNNNNDIDSKLQVSTNGQKQTTIKQNDEGANGPNQPNTYTDSTGKVWNKHEMSNAESITLPFMNGLTANPASGTIKQYNGQYYLFLNDNTTAGPTWFRVTPSGE